MCVDTPNYVCYFLTHTVKHYSTVVHVEHEGPTSRFNVMKLTGDIRHDIGHIYVHFLRSLRVMLFLLPKVQIGI